MLLSPPPVPLVLARTKESYEKWHGNFVNLKRSDRYTVGAKIDEIFLSLLELIFLASFAYDKFEKLSFVSKTVTGCDLLRFLLQIVWEQKIIDTKTYGAIILNLEEVGRMLGGWKKNIEEKTPPR